MRDPNVGNSHKSFKGLLASMFALGAMFNPPKQAPKYSSTAFAPIVKGQRNPKNPTKLAAIKRHHKAKRLLQLSRSKRRAVYYYNLRHPVKMYV